MITPDIARARLAPVRRVIVVAIRQAWEDMRGWIDSRDDKGVPLGKGCRAFIMYELMTSYLRRELATIPDVDFAVGDGGLFLTQVGADTVIRFNKLDEDGFPCGWNGTGQSKSWALQQSHLFLGAPEAETACITVGYTPDVLGQALVSIRASCVLGDQLVWSIPLDDDRGGDEAIGSPDVPQFMPGLQPLRRKGDGEVTGAASA